MRLVYIQVPDRVLPLRRRPVPDDDAEGPELVADKEDGPIAVVHAVEEDANALVVGGLPALVEDVLADQLCGCFDVVLAQPLDTVSQGRFLRLARFGRLLSTACSFLRFSFIDITFRFERLLFWGFEF